MLGHGWFGAGFNAVILTNIKTKSGMRQRVDLKRTAGTSRRCVLALASFGALGGATLAGCAAPSMRTTGATPNLAAVDAALRRMVEQQKLVGVSYAVSLRGRPVGGGTFGWADREARVPLREDHLFRVFSNTKLALSCAALQLMEQGHFKLDDPVEKYLPELCGLRVLRPGSRDLNDTVPAERPVTIRQLLVHTCGMTYTFLDPAAPIGQLYARSGMLDPSLTLAQATEVAGRMPLLFQPGSDWNYSQGTDVVGRLLEVVTRQTLDVVLKTRIFDPLGMQDTFFFIPEDKQSRLAAMYVGDLKDHAKRVLNRADQLPYPSANLRPVPRLFAGGGLVTSLPDWMKLLAPLSTGGAPLLRPETLRLVYENQLEAGLWIKSLADGARVPGRAHSLVGSVTTTRLAAPWAGEAGDVEWGGLAGTHWLLSPRDGLACALMTQRFMGFELPFWMDFKRALRTAMPV